MLVMTISIIIPCHNAARTIGCLLEAIAGQTWTDSWEVIVSDNGSTDDSLSVVERYRSRLRRLQIVQGLDRLGAGYARSWCPVRDR
jgi:glycosyltransferase involved in cell wall biosynthesis